MKTTIKLLAVLALALATSGQHSAAQAGGGLGFKFKGPSLVASFLNISGCISTDVFVIASEAMVQDAPGTPSALSFASATIYQYDTCTNTALLHAYGSTNPLPNSAFQVSKMLDTASLNTTINVFDEISGSSFDVDIDLAWTATGPLNRDRAKSHVKSPGCIMNSNYLGKSRAAQASGTVSDGMVNFASGPSISATISSVRSGNVVIGCN